MHVDCIQNEIQNKYVLMNDGNIFFDVPLSTSGILFI